MRITHPNGIVEATVPLPSSKSISNRALILRFLAGSATTLNNLSTAGDTVLLQRLLSHPPADVDVRDAGTVFRFLLAALSATPGTWRLTGTTRLMERPVAGLVDALRELGADIRYEDREGFAPLRISGRPLRGGPVTLAANTSSQFITALLMVAPTMKEGMKLTLAGTPVSAPYISMTRKVMESFGLQVSFKGATLTVAAQPFRAPEVLEMEPDWSSSAFWFETAALSRAAHLFLPGLRDSGLQGDAAIVGLMKPFGVTCVMQPDGCLLEKKQSPPAVISCFADCRDTPDLAPALVATAAGLGWPARFAGLDTLNLKESHRQDVLEAELLRNGIRVRTGPGTLEIQGGELVRTPSFRSHGDHRMVMAFAPLALRTDAVRLDAPGAVVKSYPAFWDHMKSAGFSLSEEPARAEQDAAV
jgi:3-phosphoshikimate 1-carboxyvinyltransferase